ncbi:MAG: pyruvate dehydrogenase (acetyl-transferring) E1 component subunit alpha [Oligoflexia bacterium]|nr:pyruvate dehydrogenase (acetyl-transferring) E1 component subunit alpha [Oligoflexia bacterium]
MPLEVIGTFNVSRLQVLDHNGELDQEFDPKLSSDKLLKLYYYMLLNRRTDERMVKLQRQGRLGTFGASTGQEATICAATLAMGERDWFVPSYRESFGAVMRGMQLSKIFLYWSGHEEGNYTPEAPRTLPIQVIVGSQALHAVGIAYAIKYRREKESAVVTFFGDGATSQGDIHEAMNFASVWKVPVVFICQNNQWAISQPRSRQTNAKTIAQRAYAYDMPGIQVDGNDALAVYKVTKEALERAYQGQGPSFIEAENYRLTMHTTADDPTKYRKNEEVDFWWQREPLKRFRAFLESKALWSEAQQVKLEEQLNQEIETAVRDFESQKNFKVDAPFEHIFGTTHSVIESQRAEFLAEQLKRQQQEQEQERR